MFFFGGGGVSFPSPVVVVVVGSFFARGAPRRKPHLPEREASKLRQKLNEVQGRAGLFFVVVRVRVGQDSCCVPRDPFSAGAQGDGRRSGMIPHVSVEGHTYNNIITSTSIPCMQYSSIRLSETNVPPLTSVLCLRLLLDPTKPDVCGVGVIRSSERGRGTLLFFSVHLIP